MKNILKVTFVIIGTAIGAGFASGKEIFTFFNSYGAKGIIGILFSSLLTGYVIFKVLSITQKNELSHYEEFLEILHKSKKKKKMAINQMMNAIVNLFLLITFFIMIAGFSAYFSQELRVPAVVGSFIIAAFCYLTFMGDMKAIIKASSLLVPILIGMILLLGVKGTITPISQYSYRNEGSWLMSAILYSSYNSILLIPILIPLKDYIQKKKEAVLTGVLCSAILIRFRLYHLFSNSKNRLRCNQIRTSHCLYSQSVWFGF